jgi:hypothetical protein
MLTQFERAVKNSMISLSNDSHQVCRQKRLRKCWLAFSKKHYWTLVETPNVWWRSFWPTVSDAAILSHLNPKIRENPTGRWTINYWPYCCWSHFHQQLLLVLLLQMWHVIALLVVLFFIGVNHFQGVFAFFLSMKIRKIMKSQKLWTWFRGRKTQSICGVFERQCFS